MLDIAGVLLTGLSNLLDHDSGQMEIVSSWDTERPKRHSEGWLRCLRLVVDSGGSDTYEIYLRLARPSPTEDPFPPGGILELLRKVVERLQHDRDHSFLACLRRETDQRDGNGDGE